MVKDTHGMGTRMKAPTAVRAANSAASTSFCTDNVLFTARLYAAYPFTEPAVILALTCSWKMANTMMLGTTAMVMAANIAV